MSNDGSASRDNGNDAGHILRSWMESALAEPKSGLSNHEWQELAWVVTQFGTEPNRLAECAQQLVSAFIRMRFPTIKDEQMRSRMSEKIAHTLCADPTARGRLMELQRLLQQSSSQA